jgi:hypothetical protein
MDKLGAVISPMKLDFIVAKLRPPCDVCFKVTPTDQPRVSGSNSRPIFADARNFGVAI